MSKEHTKRRFRIDAVLTASVWKVNRHISDSFCGTFLTSVGRESNRNGSQQRRARIGFKWKDGGFVQGLGHFCSHQAGVFFTTA